MIHPTCGPSNARHLKWWPSTSSVYLVRTSQCVSIYQSPNTREPAFCVFTELRKTKVERMRILRKTFTSGKTLTKCSFIIDLFFFEISITNQSNFVRLLSNRRVNLQQVLHLDAGAYVQIILKICFDLSMFFFIMIFNFYLLFFLIRQLSL